MPESNNKFLVVCDDEILIDFINKILCSLNHFKTKYIAIDEFVNSPSLDNVRCILVDEQKYVKNLLSINHSIKIDYPDIKLIVITGYIEGDFDAQFINSGADYVIPVNNLNDKLTEICNLLSSE